LLLKWNFKFPVKDIAISICILPDLSPVPSQGKMLRIVGNSKKRESHLFLLAIIPSANTIFLDTCEEELPKRTSGQLFSNRLPIGFQQSIGPIHKFKIILYAFESAQITSSESKICFEL